MIWDHKSVFGFSQRNAPPPPPSVFIYLKRMHEVRRMIATLREIFMSELRSIKSLVYASMFARAFNRVAGNIVHFKYC